MNLIVLLIILIILFGGGGFYLGGPYVGGGLGTVLLIVLIVLLVRGMRTLTEDLVAAGEGRPLRSDVTTCQLTLKRSALARVTTDSSSGSGRVESPTGWWSPYRPPSVP
jgi:hypothetical protein